jgi:hypothetical protein
MMSPLASLTEQYQYRPTPAKASLKRDAVLTLSAYATKKGLSLVPAYTEESGARAWVGVNTSRGGRRFLQTHADGIWRDNLLALAECR